MFLSDSEIDHRIRMTTDAWFKMVIDPYSPYGFCKDDQISFGQSSAGYDVCIGWKFKVCKREAGLIIDPKKVRRQDQFIFRNVEVARDPGHVLIIPPNDFALGESVEYVEVPKDCICLVVGKSTYARCGLIVNVTPLEPGWRGKITMELSNTTPLPVMVYPGEGIAQILFGKISGPVLKTYGDKPRSAYQDQPGLVLPPLLGVQD